MLALGLAVIPWVVQAQGEAAAVQDWRQANETVGQYPRGHADVLRWENAQAPAASAGHGPAPAFALASAPDAVRAAWAVHRDLNPVLARLDSQTVGHIAAGHWGMIDPSLQRRLHGFDELLDVAATTRKAWFSAVAARQTVQHLEDALTAAEAAAELGRRMVSVGNWSRYQQAPFELSETSAKLALKRARLATRQAEWALLKAMGLDTVHEQVALPDRLPDAPHTAMDEAALQQRLAALQGHLPTAQSRKARVNAMQAYAAYAASVETYHSYRVNVLKQQELISEETLLRYNGMLESVWGLLASVGSRSQAVVAAIGAQRDALVAETDLQWVLQGGQPAAFVSLSGGEPAASAAAGH
ncbi:hypothetical protein GCM10027292_24900 [Hydrogenophaga aquatica]